MTPPNDPLQPWKKEPPKTPDEAAAADLLQEVRSMPTLSPEALARVERRLLDNVRRRAEARRVPLFAMLRPAVLASGLAVAMIVGGFSYVITESRRSSTSALTGSVAMAPSAPSARDQARGVANFEAPTAPMAAAPVPAPAPAAQLASREWSQPPPDIAPEDRRRSQLGAFGAGGAGLGKGASYGGSPGFVAQGQLHHAPAAKAKKEAMRGYHGFARADDLPATGAAPRGESGAGADLSEKSLDAMASAEPEKRPEADGRLNKMAGPAKPAAAPRAPAHVAALGAPAPTAPSEQKDELAAADAPAPPAEANGAPERAFATPPPPAAAPVATAAVESEAQSGPSNDESEVDRGEQLARTGRYREAIVAFSPVADSGGSSDLVQRALIGRARCRLNLGQEAGGQRDLATYLSQFPNGRFATVARSLQR